MLNFERMAGLIRHLMTILGTYFATAGIMPDTVVDEWAAGGIVLIGFVWSLMSGEKQGVPWARVVGFVRHSLGAGGAYLVAAGILSAGFVEQAIPIVLMLGSALWSYLSPEKSAT